MISAGDSPQGAPPVGSVSRQENTMSAIEGAKTMTNICAAVIRRVKAMDEFAAGGASGCAASATLCVIISFSAVPDASGWAALVWAAVTIGALGAYIFVRGLSAQATSYNDSELTGSAAGKRNVVMMRVQQSAKARGRWPFSLVEEKLIEKRQARCFQAQDDDEIVLRREGNADGR
jgi:hypothetical protein